MYDCTVEELIIPTKRTHEPIARFEPVIPKTMLEERPKKPAARIVGPDEEKRPKVPHKAHFLFGQLWPLYAEDQEPVNTSYTNFVDDILSEPDNRRPDASQTNKSASRVFINKLMKRPNNTKVCNTQIKKFDEENSKKAYQQWYKASEKIVKTEIDLPLLSKPILLKYEPIPCSHQSRYEGFKSRATYEAAIPNADGTTQKVKVANDWVQANFTKEALSIVQRVHKESREEYIDKYSGRKEKGYLSLHRESELEDNFHLEVTNLLTSVVDRRQVSKIRYLPPRTKVTDEGDIELPGKWKGVIKTPDMDEVEIVDLHDEWVEENISESFKKMLMSLHGKNTAGFILIPEGENEKHKDETYSFLPDAPETKYHNIQGEHRCVLGSAASGLHFLGHYRLAQLVSSAGQNKHQNGYGLLHFRKVIENQCTQEERKIFQLIKLKTCKILNTWDVLVNAPAYRMCVIGIRSTDGKTDHAITIVGNWIFDSNFERALPLTRESLDLCSSSADRNTDFAGVTRGYMLKARSTANK